MDSKRWPTAFKFVISRSMCVEYDTAPLMLVLILLLLLIANVTVGRDVIVIKLLKGERLCLQITCELNVQWTKSSLLALILMPYAYIFT